MSKAELHTRYWINGQSCVDIAAEIGRDAKTVWKWMKDYGLETRPRGADDRQHFKPGQPSVFSGMKHTAETKEKLRKAKIGVRNSGLFKPNGDHVLKGRRGAAHPSWKGGATPLRQAFYASEEWKKACVEVWHRDDAKCQNCGLDHRSINRRERKFHVHHIKSFARHPQLRAEPANLVLLCDTCHRWVHSRANIEKRYIET